VVRIVVFGPERRVGALLGDRVVDLNAAYAKHLRGRGRTMSAGEAESLLPADLEGLIVGGRAALDRAREALERADRDDQEVVHPADAVRIHAPWVRRARIACAGGNYAEHVANTLAARTGKVVTPEEVARTTRAAQPWGFFKVLDRVLGPGDDVEYPSRATQFDYEGEVAVVIGAPAKDLPADRAAEVIWGVTLLNDWSIRNDMGEPRPMSFNLPKNFDGSASVGPCVVVDELDPQDVAVEVRVDGELRQSYRSRDMIFSFAKYLEFLSRDFTFLPGDVLAGGTGAGTAMDATRPRPDGSVPTDLFLKPGQRVEVSSPSIGVLANRVVAKGQG
jgi:2-keto-4-pentenoate hydratase/2-oxohepta-3-ene-1,7-dioic acid hydratase in catechol pathway